MKVKNGKYLHFYRSKPSIVYGYFVVDDGVVTEHEGSMEEVPLGPITPSVAAMIHSIGRSTIASLRLASGQ